MNHSRFRTSLPSERGLTLIEIMIVLTILAIVSGFLLSRLSGAGDKAKANLTKLKIKEIGSAIDQYRLQYNALPGSVDDLTRCNEKTGPDCIPPYKDDSDVLKDGWGNKFTYQLEGNGRTYKISSFGADGISGGEGVDYDIFGTGP